MSAKPNLSALIIGGDGLIGRALFETLKKSGISLRVTTRRAQKIKGDFIPLDLSRDITAWQPPQARIVFICAAIARLQDCHDHPQSSHHINVTQTIALAKKCIKEGSHVVFLSSNQVFDGSLPHRSALDSTCPVSVYGKQKAEAEKQLLELEGTLSIVRLTKVVHPKMDLLQNWLSKLRQKEAISVFDDMTLSPVLLKDVVDVLSQWLKQKVPSGIYQMSGAEDISYFQWAQYLARGMNQNFDLVKPSSCVQSGLLSEPQPRFTSLNTDSTTRVFRWKALKAQEAADSLLSDTQIKKC